MKCSDSIRHNRKGGNVLTVFTAMVFSALPFAQSYGALQIKYMAGTSPENMAEVDAYHLREEMEGWAAEICRSYTATAENPHGSTAAVDDEVMYFSFDYDGVAATGGNTIWLNLPFFRGNPYDARGALVHEMGHVVQGCLSRYLTKQAGEDREIKLDNTIRFDNGKVEHLTESLAEWVRRYCFAPADEVQSREYELAKSGYAFNDVGDGAGLIAYLRRTYGAQILNDLLIYCSTNRGEKIDTMWPALTGRTYDELLGDWRHEERITDAIVQWTANGTQDGIRRINYNKCTSFNFSSRTGSVKSGIEDGNWTVAMRGKFEPQPSGAGDAVFALGSDFRIAASASQSSHTMVAVKEGTSVKVYLDGVASVSLQMTAGADLSRDVSIGSGFECQDYRMFDRALNANELRQYFDAFPSSYDPLAPTVARWIGQADGNLSNEANWECVNSNGDNISSVPTAATAVVAWGEKMPNIPQGAALPCASFTVKRWATLDKDTDLRGLSVPVTIDADATIRTDGYKLTANAVTGETLRLYGHLAYNSLDLSGDLILCGGSILEMPTAGTTHIGGSLEIQGSELVFIKLAGGELPAGEHTILTAGGGFPDDLSLLRMTGLTGRKACMFTAVGNTLKAVVTEGEICMWTGAAGDGRFSTAGNWADGVKPTVGGGEPIVFAAESAATATNDIGSLSPAYIEFAQGCAPITVAGEKFSLPAGTAITLASTVEVVFTAPVEFAGDIHTIGDVRFDGGVTAPDIHADQTDIYGNYTLTYSGEWTPKGRYAIQSGSSLTVDSCLSSYKDDNRRGIAILEGGAFTARVFRVANDAHLVEVNHGVFTVTEECKCDYYTKMSYVDSCTGEFRLNRLKTNTKWDYVYFEFNARHADWDDVNAATSKVNVVMGPGGMGFNKQKLIVWNNRALALGCSSDWTMESGTSDEAIVFSARTEDAAGPMRLLFNTADHDDPSVKHTVTIAGRIANPNVGVAAYGGGTLKFSNTSGGQFGSGLAVLDATTLEYASPDAKAGGGDVYLAPGSTLALPSAGSGAVSVTGKLAFTNGVGTVHVRLGDGNAAIRPGTYSLLTAGGGVAEDLVQRLRLVNKYRAATFRMDGNTLYIDVAPDGAYPHWIDEAAGTTGLTGRWSGDVSYNNGIAFLEGVNIFAPYNASTGNVVMVETTAQFCEYIRDDTPDAAAQAAVRLGTNGCFQVWAGEKSGVESGGVGELGWVDVEAEGVVPVSGAEYTLRTTFDYTVGTYSVEAKTGLTEFTRLVEKENPVNPVNPVRTSFQLAVVTNCISSIGFVGETYFTSLYGEGRYEIIGFVADEALALSNNVQIVLDAAKAAWLNNCAGGKATVAGAAAGLSEKDFTDAYLLNLDITDGDRSYTFEITDIDVGDTSVTVAVTLTRSGNIAQPINGILKFYGAATLAAFKDGASPLGVAELSNETFAGGETATAAIPLDGETPPAFFNAKIEEQ